MPSQCHRLLKDHALLGSQVNEQISAGNMLIVRCEELGQDDEMSRLRIC